MSWATPAIGRLQRGETITIRPQGKSMAGVIESGDRVTIVPLTDQTLESGDIVLCHCGRNDYLHFIKNIKGSQYLIGNNRGNVNGWVSRTAIYGIVRDISP